MSRENEALLEESLKRNDLFDPIIARELRNGSYQILGGQHRTKVAKKLGFEELPVVVLKDISDNKAKEISLIDNARYGADDSMKLADLLNSLDDVYDLSSFMPISNIEIETLISATKFDFDELEMLDDDLDEIPVAAAPLQKTHTIMRFKVSIEDAAEIQELIAATIKVNGFSESDALTNAGDALTHILLN